MCSLATCYQARGRKRACVHQERLTIGTEILRNTSPQPSCCTSVGKNKSLRTVSYQSLDRIVRTLRHRFVGDAHTATSASEYQILHAKMSFLSSCASNRAPDVLGRPSRHLSCLHMQAITLINKCASFRGCRRSPFPGQVLLHPEFVHQATSRLNAGCS